ncbi:CDP-diacylglycerol--serine O-phosphatidyltransferase [Lujinxingia vulgaris]|uniref:CDP-diacylglycerol--serine O-phosphatidyltransferase n=1 Tax=Lujinxingia vulgaris TaxID=2600176 RepID=A0A5C6X6R0_9DELT|nr:CDP-diacylglycerol--serine O-phosphatidyltransferase [Lujinxingia vulgaris]TXD33650.1 CDP-diacylglycerol--serine O-phosphatidyltransferase [Lujinxingia vulgaris]
MSSTDEWDEPAQPARRKRFEMLRSFALADIITMANAACGVAAIFCCLNYMDEKIDLYVWWAFGLLPLALVFDLFDGAVARWRRKHSALGADLDSLADIVSFGVAPAVLAYTLGMRGGWDAVVLIYFVVCGIARLARYNVTAAELSQGTGKVPYYEGTPIPTSLVLVLVMAVAFDRGAYGAALWGGNLELLGWGFHPLVLLFGLSGSAMISTHLRIKKIG